MRHPFFDLDTPLVIGHRGAAGERPENTLPSFERALEQGAVVLETDVHLSCDGHVVIAHDPDVGRTTEGRGDVASLSLEELRGLDAGHRHTEDGGHPWRNRGVRIPTLREAFEAFPDARFNIELKRCDPRLVEATLDAVEAFDRASLTLLAAAEDDTMRLLRERLRVRRLPVAMGASTGDVVGFVRAAQGGNEPPPEPMALQIPEAFGGHPLATPELVAFAHARDVQVHVWTVNDPDAMHRLLELGVDGIVSDWPGRLRDVVAARRRGAR